MSEAKKRRGKIFQQWQDDEIKNVWKITRDYAQQHDRRVPTVAEIISAEQYACGHVDYVAKWAIGVHFLLRRSSATSESS